MIDKNKEVPLFAFSTNLFFTQNQFNESRSTHYGKSNEYGHDIQANGLYRCQQGINSRGVVKKFLMIQQVFGVTNYKSKTNNNCIYMIK